jgi:tetratricopeptide (TPR) repeat protein
MDKQRWTALAVLGLATAALAYFLYGRVMVEDAPGDYQVKTGNYRLEDRQYEAAIREFDHALERNPQHAGAHLGLALVYLQTDRLEDAVAELDETLKMDPGLAAAYANRGIARDRQGRHEQALADYRAGLELEPRLAKGPGWLWRFLRNIDEKPPTLADRAAYLEAELAKPLEERLLQVPEEDAKQRMYRVE